MEKKSIQDHLVFFNNNIVDLNNQNINVEIEKYFDRNEFINNIDFLERNTLIIENEGRNLKYSITKKGEKVLIDITKELELESEKDRIEFEKSKIDLVLAKKMLKEYPYTKWFARIGAFIGILLGLKELGILIKNWLLL